MPQALPGPFPLLQGTLRRYRHPNTELCLWHSMATSGHREVTTPEATFAPSQAVLLVALCGVGAAGMLLRAQGQSGDVPAHTQGTPKHVQAPQGLSWQIAAL